MNCYHMLAAVAALLAIEPVLAVEMPCPVPGLEEVVDTAVKCNCFYSLAGSGLDLGDSSTFSKVFADDSVQNFSQTGQYVGSEGIAEYLSYVKGGAWVQDYILIGMPLFLDMTGSTMDQCVATIAERRRMPYNPAFSYDNQDLCVDVVAGSTLYYTMTGNQAAPVAIQKANAWLPDELFTGTNPYFVDTPATAEYVCDVIVNSCGKKSESSKKSSKKSKSMKGSKSMKKCLKKFNALPNNDSTGGLTYIDGNSKGCRILHSYFAKTNPDHCPHISFEADEDVNGIVKCDQSKGTVLTDLFTEEQLGLFKMASTMLGLGDSGLDVKLEACPAS